MNTITTVSWLYSRKLGLRKTRKLEKGSILWQQGVYRYNTLATKAFPSSSKVPQGLSTGQWKFRWWLIFWCTEWYT